MQKWLLLCIFFFLFSCTKTENFSETETKKFPLKYAENYQIDSLDNKNFLISVQVFLANDTVTTKYLLTKNDSSVFQKKYKDAIKIHIPVKRIVALSGTYYAFLDALEETERIVGFSSAKEAADTLLYKKIKANQIAEVSKNHRIDEERIYKLNPDLVLNYATGSAFDADLTKLKKAGIPVLLTSEWQEISPLGKAEWIYLFRFLTDNFRADSVFKETADAYEFLKDSIARQKNSCTPVLAGTPSGGFFYAPGDNSYTNTLIQDAGGCLVFEKESKKERKLSLESAYLAARKAKIWINPGVSSERELLNADKRIEKSDVFKNKRIYNYHKQQGTEGAFHFYEKGILKPAEILADFIKILNTENIPDSSLLWYKNIFYN